MAITKSVQTEEKMKASAFVNWSIETKNGGTLRSSKGFPIFENPLYPNKEEDLLLEAARKAAKQGEKLELTMQVRICLNQTQGTAVTADDLL